MGGSSRNLPLTILLAVQLMQLRVYLWSRASFPTLNYMNAAQVSTSSCLGALLGAGHATIKGVLIDDILLPAEGKENDGSDNCYKLTGGPSGSPRLLCLLPITGQYLSVENLPRPMLLSEKGVPFPRGTHET